MSTRPTGARRRLLVHAFGAGLGGVVGLLAAFAPSVAVVPSAFAASSAPMSACTLPSDGSMGALDWDTFRRPVGTLKAVMLFIDFSDVPATTSPAGVYDSLFAKAPGWLATSSYGKLNLSITPVEHWIRMPKPLSAYPRTNGALMGKPAGEYFADAVAAADPEIDLSGVQIVYLVPPAAASAYPRSSGGVWNPEEGAIADGHDVRAMVEFGSDIYARGYKVLDHETSHLFGPRDYYSTTGAPTYAYAGSWSVMADPINGGDHFAWDKWRMGWLPDSSLACVVGAGTSSFVLSPVETRGGIKAVVLRTGLQTAVVAEFRSRVGLDAGLCSSGVLIVKINSALIGGKGPVRVSDANPHSAHSGRCGGELDDAAYRPGGRWTDSTSGLEIDITYVGSGARVRVVRTKSYLPPTSYARSVTSSVGPNPDGSVALTANLAAADGFATCIIGKPLSLQQWNAGEWWTLRTANTTATGTWMWTFTPEPRTQYRFLAPEKAATAYDCGRAVGSTFTAG